MYRSSTPTHIIELPFDYEQFVDKILINYKQGSQIVLEKTENDIEYNGNIVSYTLTEEQTNKFIGDNIVKIQVRVKDKSGKSIPSDIIEKSVFEVLDDREL